ncbi:hypothetical protein N8703_05605 [Verrucomicrobia bacterium]|nr:hypothetical protein [Verrucomicrobiota bacterium]
MVVPANPDQWSVQAVAAARAFIPLAPEGQQLAYHRINAGEAVAHTTFPDELVS